MPAISDLMAGEGGWFCAFGMSERLLWNYARYVKPSPCVVVLTGPPGAGKSSTGLELARLMRAAILDQDAMTNALVDVVGDVVGVHDYDDVRLASLVRVARYASLLRVAADCVAAGVSVILVAPFTSERRNLDAWSRLVEEVAAFGGEARLVWLRISPEELADRLRARAAARDAGKLVDIKRYVGGLDLEAPVAPFIEVDAALPATEQAEMIRQVLTS